MKSVLFCHVKQDAYFKNSINIYKIMDVKFHLTLEQKDPVKLEVMHQPMLEESML